MIRVPRMEGILLELVEGVALIREGLSIVSPARRACTQILGSILAAGTAWADEAELPFCAAPA